MEVRDSGLGIIYYEVRISNTDAETESIVLKSIGIFKNGKLIRIEPQEHAENYNELLGAPAPAPVEVNWFRDGLVDKLSEWLNEWMNDSHDVVCERPS
jgi:hypothetical protein